MTTKPTRPTKPEIDQAEQELNHLWRHVSKETAPTTSAADFCECLQAGYSKLHDRSPLGYKLLLIAEGILYKELEGVNVTPPRARSVIPNFDAYFVKNAPRICKSLCDGMRNAIDLLDASVA